MANGEFETSVKTTMKLKKRKPDIDKKLPKAKWNIDLDDVDNILRIDSDEDVVLIAIDLLTLHNYSCEELD